MVGLLFAVLLLAGGFRVSAAILEDSQTFAGVNGTFPLVFNQFNPVWGTLNSVSVSFSLYSTGGNLRFDNDGGTSASGNVRFGSDGSIFSEDLTGLPDEPLTLTARAASPLTAVSVDIDDGDAEVGGTTGFSMVGSDYATVVGGNYSQTRTADLSDYVAGFLGVGTYSITAEASQYVSASAFGGAQQQIDPSSVSGTVVIIYDYTGDGPAGPPPASTVPEPTTLSLLLASFLGLRLFRRR